MLTFFICSLMLLPHPWSPTHSPCPWLQYSPHHWHITRTLKAQLLQLTVLWSSKNPVNSSPALSRILLLVPLLQLPGLLILTRFSNLSTGLRYRSASNTKLFLPLIRFYSLPVHITSAQSSLEITNRSFRYAAPHLWNKLTPCLRVPCPSATSECSPPLPDSDSAPKSMVGVSHRVFHSRLETHLFSRSFPRNFPLSLTDWFHGFYPARVRKSLALKTLASAAD